ncbi:MAG: DUF4038 domain-containing protein, partial [Prevotella sp.]|nr:DUF4038 domain-containing protein [Prevotella sp.]
MKKSITLMLLMFLALSVEAARETIYHPWDNGKLVVSKNSRYLVHENGTPFFWLGNTSWLLPERLNRDEVDYYLGLERKAGYNVEQIQVLNGIPTFNIYGHPGNNAEFDFSKVTKEGVYGYWEHMDYIIDVAARNGIYI